METFTENCLANIEYLIHQSTKGVHLFFDKDSIKDCYLENKQLNKKEKNKVADLLAKFINKNSYIEKKCFLETLKGPEKVLFIRGYFDIVESTLKKVSCYH